jgi:hypothetical protein
LWVTARDWSTVALHTLHGCGPDLTAKKWFNVMIGNCGFLGLSRIKIITIFKKWSVIKIPDLKAKGKKHFSLVKIHQTIP